MKVVEDLKIIPGTLDYLNECKEAFKHSELGDAYFSSDELITSRFIDCFNAGEIFVAVDDSNNFLGFIGILQKGAFGDFPYCRSLAVKKEFRGIICTLCQGQYKKDLY